MKRPSLRIFSLVLCLLALLLCVSDVSAQCGANGTAGCGAPAISQLNSSLANQLAQASTSAASSATSTPRSFAVPQQIVTVPQQIQVAPQQVQVQAAPQVQYVQVPAPQVQYVQQPVQYVQTLPQVQFSTAPLAFSAPAASASAGSSAAASASTALPIVAAQPAAILTGCASGNCGRASLLQALRRPAKSVSVSRSRTRG